LSATASPGNKPLGDEALEKHRRPKQSSGGATALLSFGPTRRWENAIETSERSSSSKPSPPTIESRNQTTTMGLEKARERVSSDDEDYVSS
jgi:hypothetical protein